MGEIIIITHFQRQKYIKYKYNNQTDRRELEIRKKRKREILKSYYNSRANERNREKIKEESMMNKWMEQRC